MANGGWWMVDGGWFIADNSMANQTDVADSGTFLPAIVTKPRDFEWPLS
jgi:hypothetical protein